MSDNEIEPALAADEWTKGVDISVGLVHAWLDADPRYLTGDLEAVGHTQGPWLVIAWNTVETETATHRPAALMALGNAALPDNDPRKITRADVAKLEEMAKCDLDQVSHFVKDIQAIASKLRALLPPE